MGCHSTGSGSSCNCSSSSLNTVVVFRVDFWSSSVLWLIRTYKIPLKGNIPAIILCNMQPQESIVCSAGCTLCSHGLIVRPSRPDQCPHQDGLRACHRMCPRISHRIRGGAVLRGSLQGMAWKAKLFESYIVPRIFYR